MYKIITEAGNMGFEAETMKGVRSQLRALLVLLGGEGMVTIVWPDGSRVVGTINQIIDPVSEARLVRAR